MNTKTKNVYIIGDITTDTIKEIVLDLNEDKKIAELEELNIYISSAGGDLYACLGMIDFINYQRKKYGYKINTYGLGEVASGGFFMFVLGNNRYMSPMCRIFVHEHIVVDDECWTYSEKIKELKEEKILNRYYIKSVADSLDLSIKDATKLLRKDKWLTKKEIDRYNIVTGDIYE